MCDKLSTWDITFGSSPDGYTQSCDEHLIDMVKGSLDEARKNKVTITVWPSDPQEGHEPAKCCFLGLSVEEISAARNEAEACGDMVGVAVMRRALDLTRAQFERLAERSGAPKPADRIGIMRFWKKDDIEQFRILANNMERRGLLKR
jgi:hypothetical protein